MSVPTSPPRGHPMEPGKFPGPLYPPGAAPRYTPSPKTPFAEAVKRCLGHCGFWPWDPESYDQAYSDAVAYGVEGNPEKAGVKAFQRWSGTLDATGSWGEKSFNFARSVTVPQGRPQAGNPAWDQVCVQLTQQAYEQAYPPKPKTTVREAALALAITQLGTKESPPESNHVKYCEWYYGNPNTTGPWCAMFTSWAYETNAQGGSPSFDKSAGRFAYVPYVVSDGRSGRYGLSITQSPLPGDLVCYDWGGTSPNASSEAFDHIGLFEAWTEQQPAGSVFTAIEGNTSTSSNSNGGEVQRRTRNKNAQGTVFVRVAEP